MVLSFGIIVIMLKTHSISIHHENVLVERGINSNDVSHLMVDFQLQWRHGRVEVDTIQIVHEQNLRVTLSSIAGFRPFAGFPDFDDDNIPE